MRHRTTQLRGDATSLVLECARYVLGVLLFLTIVALLASLYACIDSDEPGFADTGTVDRGRPDSTADMGGDLVQDVVEDAVTDIGEDILSDIADDVPMDLDVGDLLDVCGDVPDSDAADSPCNTHPDASGE